MSEPLQKFGAFFVQNLRDSMFDRLEMLLAGKSKAPATKKLQTQVKGLSDTDKQTIRELVESVVTSGMHDFLFALQEMADFDNSIRVLVDGVEIATESDGLHGELFGKNGWIAQFSKYPVQE